MNSGKICISVCAKTGREARSQIERAASIGDIVELRLDCVDPSEVDELLGSLPRIGQYLVTFRPHEQGGNSRPSKIDRMKFWSYALAKLRGYDFLVDLEGDIDFLLQLDPARTIVSLHDFENRLTDLSRHVDLLSELTGKTIKVAVSAQDITDSIEVWKFLDRKERAGKDVIPIAMGEAGKWTRILGLAHGAPLTYASLDGGSRTAPGQINATDLRDVFRVKELDTTTRVYGIVAGDTSYSVSPYMHNAAFRASRLNSVFVPLKVADPAAFIRRMVRAETREVELNFRGFSITNPHKQNIIEHLDEIDETAEKIGAVNTVKIENGRLLGSNTDAEGFMAPLLGAFADLRDASVVVLGAGGAARACVYALKRAGASVRILARDPSRASDLAREFDARVDKITGGNHRLTADILVNATPIGTKGEAEGLTPFAADELRDVRLVYDLVYNPPRTRLLAEAEAAGAKSLGGFDMLLAQGARQFEIWTGLEAPVEEMKTAVEERLGVNP